MQLLRDLRSLHYATATVEMTKQRHCEHSEAIQYPIIKFSEMHPGLPHFTSFRSQ